MRAVIMAGGEGSRLRPLTCDIPKPMARLCGKPVLEYILDLLSENGVKDAVVTLGYLPNVIIDRYRTCKYGDTQLHFSVEDKPMGTAGGVKAAADSMSESFIVISGDAMCDFDLKSAVKFHTDSGAMATIVTTRVQDPREYGLVRSDKSGRVTGFTEKPAWGQATVNTANTGIYILKPECLSLIPEGEKFDFSKDLFPHMLSEGLPLFSYEAEGYWCDIGDISAYIKCQHDMLEGKVSCKLPKISEGVFSRSVMPSGNYSVIPPVYFGEQVELGNGAVIGPNTVIDDGCLVGDGAKIRSSVMLPSSYASKDVSMTGALLCSGSTVKRSATIFEGGVVGTGAIVGAGAVVKPDKLIWPHKTVDSFAIVNDNIKYGSGNRDIFGDNGIGGDGGIELTTETCAAIGEAIGSVKSCKKVGIGYDGNVNSKAMMYALMSGLMAAGGYVWNFGECFEAQLSFFTSFCGLAIGIFISSETVTEIKVCGEGGLTIPRYLEREIEARLTKCEYNRCSNEACRDVADMSSIKMMYSRELIKQAPYELKEMSATVMSNNEAVKSIVNDALLKLYCRTGEGPQFNINRSGTRVNAVDESNNSVPYEKLLALCCYNEMKNGNDIALPFDAPQILETLAANCGRKAYRYLSSPADNSDSLARRLAAKQTWVRDGLFLTVRVLSVMKERKSPLSILLNELPQFYVEKKSFALNLLPSQLSEIIGEESVAVNNTTEGLLLKRENGRLLITPSKNGRLVSVLAEANRPEIARELCDDIEERFSKNIIKY